MPSQKLSQRTLVAVIRTLREHGSAAHGPDIGELLYEHDFPDWFVTHSRSMYGFDWSQILPEVRNTQFFFPHTYFGAPGTNITGQQYLSEQDADVLAESLLRRRSSLWSLIMKRYQYPFNNVEEHRFLYRCADGVRLIYNWPWIHGLSACAARPRVGTRAFEQDSLMIRT